MGMTIVWILLAALAVLAAVVIFRTVKFVPPVEEPGVEDPIDLDHDKIVQDMVDMIRCKTVSYYEEEKMDMEEFRKFQKLLAERFPLVHQAAELHHIGRSGLLYKLPGRSSEKPSVCMAHYDVVPIEEDGWVKPAFEGIVEDGHIWGRGTLDTKGTLCGIFEALESLLGREGGFTPENDLYLSFSGGEEVDGEDCPMIVEWLRERGIVPALVVDEGGAVVDGVFPGVDKSCAVVGIGEKGMLNVNFTLESDGGHASTPPKNGVVKQLADAIVAIEKHPFPTQMTRPVEEMFDALGRHSTFLYRMIFANLWLFGPVLSAYCSMAGGELNALMRTTVALTRMDGSKAYNVLPPKASFGANLRLLGTDTTDSAVEYLRGVIKNDNIKIEAVNAMNPSPYSDTTCDEWLKLKDAIHNTWPDAIVAPYLMMACSDSRSYNAISDRVYRFSAMYLTAEERAMIHGNNERIPIPTLIKTVEFYVRLIRGL